MRNCPHCKAPIRIDDGYCQTCHLGTLNSPPLSDDELLTAILQYGLAIRQIPRTVTELRNLIQMGDDVLETELTRYSFEFYKTHVINSANWRFDEENKRVFRRYSKRVTTPKHAGYWMCQQVTDTSSTVQWNSKQHNLAPTLAESVALFLKKNQPKQSA